MGKFKIINAIQVSSLETSRPYHIKMFGRWVEIRSHKDVNMWLRIRDKRLRKERRNVI